MEANARIRYKSVTKFGAVLITRKPITLTSYNDETLFHAWLATNKPKLSTLYGSVLRRHGLHLITRTYTSSGCSINAWNAKDKEVNITMKAKASMLGDLEGDLEWTERLTDKDWSHYYGKEKGDTVVVFFDGIEVPASNWWLQGLKRTRTRKRKISRSRSVAGSFHPPSGGWQSTPLRGTPLRSPKDMADDEPEEKALLNQDLWGSSLPVGRDGTIISRSNSQGPQVLVSPGTDMSVSSRETSRGRQLSGSQEKATNRSMSTPQRLSRYLDYEHRTNPPKDPKVPISTGPVTDNAQVHIPQKTRFLVPDPPPKRHSTASTTASMGGKARKMIAANSLTASPRPMLRSAMQRKTV